MSEHFGYRLLRTPYSYEGKVRKKGWIELTSNKSDIVESKIETISGYFRRDTKHRSVIHPE